jgi:hypothetical protein
MAELKKIKKVTTITDEMKLDAKAYALDKVFQRDSSLSKVFGGLKNLGDRSDSKFAKIGFKTLANIVMPFTQTPANVLDKMIEYGPGGIIKALFNSKKNGVFDQKYFVDNLSSGITGTGLLALGWYMAKKNVITTKPEQSQKIRNFQQMQGKGDFALRFGKTYYTIDWAQPTAAMLLAGAEIFKGGQRGEDAFKKTLNAITAGGDTFFNMSMLKNVSSLFGSGSSPTGSLINMLTGSSTQFTPTMGKQISQLMDPYVRETYDPNMLKEQYNKILARLPGASKTLPIKTDALGQDIKDYQGNNSWFNVLLNPGFKTTEVDNPELKEIQRLFDIEKDTDILPGKEAMNSGKFSKDKTEYTMTPEELTKFKKRYGDIVLNGSKNLTGIKELFKTKTYNYATDKIKQSLVKKRYDRAYEMAVDELLKSRGAKAKK